MLVGLTAACGGNACPAGRTPAENGTCVDQRVVDFVACIDRANGSERSASGGMKLSAEVRAASVGVSNAAEFQRNVSTRIYAGSDAQGQQILATCNSYVFGGGVALQGGAPAAPPPGQGAWNPAYPPAPSSPSSGPFVPPAQAWPAPSPAPSGTCNAELAIPNDASWSLREREQWAGLARSTQGALKAANESCAAKIGGSFVFETFRGRFTAANYAGLDQNGVDHVRAPFNAVQQICDDGEMQKSAVRSRIQCVEVRYGGGSGPSTWVLQKNVLVGIINPAGESDFDYRAQMRGPNGVRRSL